MLEWLKKAHEERPGEPSSRRIAMSFVAVATVFICLVALFTGVPEHLPGILIALISAAWGGVTIGRFAEAMDREDR
jgi:hypothetical protein